MTEMTKVDYLKAKARMVRVNLVGGCTIFCSDCPLSIRNNGMNVICSDFERLYPEEAVAIVQKWAEEHPRKTILMDFLEKYPNVNIREYGYPVAICPDDLGYSVNCKYTELPESACKECWHKPLEE